MKDDEQITIKNIGNELSEVFLGVLSDEQGLGFIGAHLRPQVLNNECFKEWRKQLQSFERERFDTLAYKLNRAEMLQRFTDIANAVPSAKTALMNDIQELRIFLPTGVIALGETIPTRENLRKELLPFVQNLYQKTTSGQPRLHAFDVPQEAIDQFHAEFLTMYALFNFRNPVVDAYALIRQVAAFGFEDVKQYQSGLLTEALKLFIQTIKKGCQAPLEDFNERFIPRTSFDEKTMKWAYKGRKTRAVKEYSFSHLMGYLLNHKDVNLERNITYEEAFRHMNVPFRKAFPTGFSNLRQKVSALNTLLQAHTGTKEKFFVNYGPDSFRFANPIYWRYKEKL